MPTPQTITVTDRDNWAIQDAIDTLASEHQGGVVHLPAGEYTLNTALRLRSNITLQGEAGTVLKRATPISIPVRDFLGFGFYEFTVTEPDHFRVGQTVYIQDDNSPGFYATVATITERDGDRFFIDRPLNHDILPNHGGRVQTIASLLDVSDASNVTIRNLTLDGNPEVTTNINGCRGGGIFMIRTGNVLIEQTEIRHFTGEGLSFQQCTDVTVRNCHLHHNRGQGLHPGSGSVRYVFDSNLVEHNTWTGLFYCLRTTHSHCLNNTIRHNGGPGISIGERDTHHLIENNTIHDNGHEGVLFRKPINQSGDYVVLRRNTIANNCADSGAADREIHLEGTIRHVSIEHNTIEARPGVAAIHVDPGCEDIHLVDNTIKSTGRSTGLIGCKDCDNSPPTEPYPIGPDKLPLNGARHLGIAELAPWQPR